MANTLEDLIDPVELDELKNHYGPFQRRYVTLDMDPDSVKFYNESFKNRRGEILFALQRADGRILIHTKKTYPKGVYRVLGGGIDWKEPIRSSLTREVHEETQFAVADEQFLGMLGYQLTSPQSQQSVPFVSYVFLVPGVEGEPSTLDESEGISGFKWVSMADLASVAETLRNLEDDHPGRADWGRFRAVGHDFIIENASGRLEA
ncbi:MAG: NUDIX hydrolase [Planctomycetales bacterium]